MTTGKYGWRVMANRDGYDFMRDELTVHIGYRDESGWRFVFPLEFKLDALVNPDGVMPAEEPPASKIPTELAGALFDCLGHLLLGISDPYEEINRLKRELARERTRVDNLIAGVGRQGGQSAEKVG